MPRSQKSMGSSVLRKTKSDAASSPPMRTAKSRKTETPVSGPYCLGIDPGLGETGLVLRRGKDVLEYVLLSDALGSTYPAFVRTEQLAERIRAHIDVWCASYMITVLEVGLEMPVYNRNIDSYAKQMRLIQAIETVLRKMRVKQLFLTECVPGESKLLAAGHGAAAKAEVFAASPFARIRQLRDVYEPSSLETLGDAWSHSLCVEGKAGVRFEY